MTLEAIQWSSPRQAQPMADVEEVGQLVGDDHWRAGLRDPGHLAKRRLGVVEVVETAVAKHGVELPVTEGHVLGFAENEPEIAAGVAALAGGELACGDVDADDRPVLRKPACVDAVAYGDVEQTKAGGLRQVSQDHVARPPFASVQCPEYTLPEPDFRPELAVVKVGRDLVVVGQGVADDEHAVANGEACAAPLGAAVEAGVRPAERAVAARAAKRPWIGPQAPNGSRVIVAIASVLPCVDRFQMGTRSWPGQTGTSGVLRVSDSIGRRHAFLQLDPPQLLRRDAAQPS